VDQDSEVGRRKCAAMGNLEENVLVKVEI